MGFKVQDLGFGIEGLGLIEDLEFKDLDLGFGIQGLGYRVWDSGFGIKCLGSEFRVWGLGVTVALGVEDHGGPCLDRSAVRVLRDVWHAPCCRGLGITYI